MRPSLILAGLFVVVGGIAPIGAEAQEISDSLYVNISFYSWRTHEPGELYHNCGTQVIGVHDDPVGRGIGSDGYSYLPSVSSYNTPEGAPQNIPGVQIAVLVARGSSGSSPGDWPDCGAIRGAVVSAWASRVVTASYYVLDGTPVAQFVWEQTDALTVSLDGSESHVATENGPQPVASYSWTHGDNPSSAVTEHTFPAPGEYEVSLTVENDAGDENTMTQTVVVTPYRLTVRALPLEPDAYYFWADTLIVETTVENTGEATVLDVVVPPFTEAISLEPGGPMGSTFHEEAHVVRLSTREPEERASLAAGESIVVRDSFVVEDLARYKDINGDWVDVEMEAWGELNAAVEASSGGSEPVDIRRPCQFGACETWTVGPYIHRVEGLVTLTTSSLNQAEAGALPGSTWDDVSFAEIGPDGNGGQIPKCRTGCIEIEAPIVTDDGSPAYAGLEVRIALEYVGIPPGEEYGGDFMCERVSVGQDADCVDTVEGSQVRLTVKTDDDGIARAWWAIPGGLESGGLLQVDAYVARLPYADTHEEAEALITVETLTDITVSFTAVSNRYANVLNNVSSFAGNISVGEHCESSIGWIREQALDAARWARYNRNVLQLYTSGYEEWACEFLISTVGEAFIFVDALKAINTVADPVKKFTDLLRFQWFAQEFGVDKASDLVTLQGPLPPPLVFWYDGDMNGFVDEAVEIMTNSEYEPQPNNRLIIKEISAIQPMGDEEVEVSHYRPNQYAGALQMDFSAPRGNVSEILSFGYTPLLSSSGNFIFSDGFLVENPTFDPAQGVVGEGDVTIEVADWPGEEGDFINIEPDGEGGPEEVLQVMGVQANSGGNFVLELAWPVVYDYGENARISWLAEGEVGPSPAPWLRSVLGPEAPEILEWVSAGASMATAFDFQLAYDTLFTDLIRNIEGTEDLEVDVSDFEFVEFETYYWRARATNRVGTGEWSSRYEFTPGTTIVSNEDGSDGGTDGLPDTFALSSAYPNPFNPSTVFRLDVPEPGHVLAAVYDALGRRVAILHDRDFAAGSYTIRFDAQDLLSGVYFVRVTAEGFHETRSVTLLK